MRITLVRHAQSVANAKKLAQGQQCQGLTHFGKQQAKLLAPYLARLGIQHIYCSQILRAKQTLEPFLQFTKIQPMYDARLNEINHGDWEGKPQDQIYPTWRNNITMTLPNGESFLDAQKRYIDFMQDKKNNTLIVTHGGVITAALCHIAGVPITTKNFDKFAPHNASVTQVEQNQIISFDYRPHSI